VPPQSSDAAAQLRQRQVEARAWLLSVGANYRNRLIGCIRDHSHSVDRVKVPRLCRDVATGKAQVEIGGKPAIVGFGTTCPFQSASKR